MLIEGNLVFINPRIKKEKIANPILSFAPSFPKQALRRRVPVSLLRTVLGVVYALNVI